MKKIIILILTFLIPLSIKAINSNVTGGSVKPSYNISSGDCDSYSYWVGFTQGHYQTQGLRVTFFDATGKQVGNTVDVYVWAPAFFNEYATSYSNTYNKINDAKAQTLKNDYGFVSYYYGIKRGNGNNQGINHSKNYYSKVDYSKIDYSKNPITDKINFEDKFTNDLYYFYFDQFAYNASSFSNCGYPDPYRYYQCATSESGPLFYIVQDGQKAKFKEYFSNPTVMKRYMHLAEADSLIDNIEVGDYQLLLESLMNVSACVGGSYSGFYTTSDFYYIRQYNKVSYTSSISSWPDWLKISSDALISGINYKTIDVKSNIFETSNPNTFFNYGIGMALVYGTEVCKDNCKANQTYKIIYRTIDLRNPFLTINGNVRKISKESNWYNNEDKIDQDIYLKTPYLTVTLTPTVIQQIRADKINYSNINNSTYNQFKIKYASIFEFSSKN